MTFEEMVQALGKGMGAEVETESDICAIEVGDDALRTVIIVHYAQEHQIVLMSADLGEPPPELLEGLYRTMLEANCSYGATGGATLGIDEETGHVQIVRYDSLYTLEDQGPFTVFEKFALAAQEWRRIVSEYRGAVESGDIKEPDGAEIPLSGAGMMQV